MVQAPQHIVTACNHAYLRWLDHLRVNLAHFGLERRLGVCAEDAATAEHAGQFGLVVHHVGQGNATAALDFDTDAYFALLHRRQACFWQVVRTQEVGARVLILDTDVTFFRNPIEALERLPREVQEADLVAIDDTGPGRPPGFKTRGVVDDRYLTGGYRLVRNTEANRRLARAFRAGLASRRGANDQAVFNDVLWPLAHAGRVTVAPLPPTRFLNGYRFYEARATRPINASSIVAVHHNWVRGDAQKWKRATRYATLVLEMETREAFWARALRAFTALGPWHA